MNAVVGLFQQDENIHTSIDRLRRAGFAADKIHVLTRYDEVQTLFKPNESHLVLKYVGWGAFFGIAIMNLYGLTVGGYACNCLSGYIPASYWACGVVGFSLLGLLLGATAGFFWGVNKFEGSADEYTHGVGGGNKLMAVRVEDEPAAKAATNILRQENAQGVKNFQDLLDMSVPVVRPWKP